MKKFITLLVLGVLILPLSVKAFAIDQDRTKCEKLECGTGDTECSSVCTIYINENTDALQSISLSITTQDRATVTEIIPEEQWTYSGTYSSATFTAVDPLGVTDSSFKLFTLKQTYPKDIENCDILVDLTNGSTITIPVDPPDEPECQAGDPNCPNTGVSLPVIVLAGGAVLAITLYSLTNKNKKMYKI